MGGQKMFLLQIFKYPELGPNKLINYEDFEMEVVENKDKHDMYGIAITSILQGSFTSITSKILHKHHFKDP